MLVLPPPLQSVIAPPTDHAHRDAGPAHELAYHEHPALLEYRGEADPDVEFIPKTVAGFALGAMLLGITVDLAQVVWKNHNGSIAVMLPELLVRFAVIFGIIGVSASLLLVGLKVRADHSAVPLFTRHWLNSIGTGALFAFMAWVPWCLMENGIFINPFVAAAIWMLVMTFPAIAAKWTIGPAEKTNHLVIRAR